MQQTHRSGTAPPREAAPILMLFGSMQGEN